MDIQVGVSRHGPVFDGRASAAVRAFIDDAEHEIAQTGVNVLQVQLDRVLKHQTPYYRTQITTDRVAGDSVVEDGGVVYGPWLAGVGSRNAPKTRFAGYNHWRVATARLQTLAKPIAERVLPKFLRRMQ